MRLRGRQHRAAERPQEPRGDGRGARVVRLPFNLEIGGAVQTGFRYAFENGFELAVRVDGDGQHDPAELARIVEPVLLGEADIVVGSRFAEAGGYRPSVSRRIGIRILASTVSMIARQRITDPTSGFQALSRPVFRFCCSDFFPFDFPDIDVLLLLARNGFRIVEVPVEMAPSPPARTAMHAGFRAVYYVYKMLLSTFRSRLVPRREPRRPEALPDPVLESRARSKGESA